MAEEASRCPLPRLSRAFLLRGALLLATVVLAGSICYFCSPGQTPRRCEPPGVSPRRDQRLHWYGSPALGRSFLLGPELDKGQLRIHRDGIYRLHVQVTLTNCSSTSRTPPHRAALTVGICSSATRSISLLRLSFEQRCTVASQRLTPLSLGDILCTNLTLPLLPSRNTDETFFGVQWVHP
uniref:CD70 antigen n=1 Tax=Jaculus jaculus TaxID=51337 RepID=A0A8C5L2M1_JACJA